MLCYLKEKCDVGFFQSMAGLMLSCRYVAMEKFPTLSDTTCQMSPGLYVPTDKNAKSAKSLLSFVVCVRVSLCGSLVFWI